MALGWLISAALLMGAPRVEKVEPPNWWLGSTWSPVRLLVRGQGFAGAKVSVKAPLQVARTWTSEAGTYLFADVTIPKTAKPGKYPVKIQTADGQCEAEFEVLPALARQGRFQGFGPDDVLYLIMPDRFANGDVSNDDPATARGLLDRTKGRYYHGGDFQGILDRAGYLKELGVTALWLNPWYDNVDH